ncbi:hypothetical protein EYF80_028733 [Liparis tanakae]|uniref:Uncharacterized protein n=1 Tax=Liparis tanakae TaxID=230148 RepID=A0A4Z2H6D2_9TELE|nr:hypothetical protein EYF80_028733 [Liparis tanakae]
MSVAHSPAAHSNFTRIDLEAEFSRAPPSADAPAQSPASEARTGSLAPFTAVVASVRRIDHEARPLFILHESKVQLHLAVRPSPQPTACSGTLEKGVGEEDLFGTVLQRHLANKSSSRSAETEGFVTLSGASEPEAGLINETAEYSAAVQHRAV